MKDFDEGEWGILWGAIRDIKDEDTLSLIHI